MPFKCSVYGCASNYATKKGETEEKEKVRLFRFPDDSTERKTWIKSLPNADFVYTESKRVCENHWPRGYPTTVVNRTV